MKLPHRTWGEPDARRRVLLVHGLSSESSGWWRVAEALAASGWSVTAVDLRGHGDAPRAERYQLDDFASDLPGSGWDLVVGHSLGGAVSVLAAQRDDFARRLVLIDPVLVVTSDSADAVMADQLAELAVTAESLATQRPHWHERDRAAKLRGVRLVDPRAVRGAFVDTETWDVSAQARRLRMPTLVLGADPDVFTMMDLALIEELDGDVIEHRVIHGAGHSVHRDRPAETIDAILEFVDR
jgi:pimeloyl-ACP methyl ester carboxylesterase